MSIEHLVPYSVPSDFVMRRTMTISGVEYAVLIIGNYSPYSTDLEDVWGVALVVDGQRVYLAGGYYTIRDAIAACRGAFGALIAVKQESGDTDLVEDDIVNFVLTHSGPDNEYQTTYYDLRRKAGY
jgi:hypothetical protein